MTHTRQNNFRSGMSMIWAVVAFSTLMLVVSLGVDYGRVQFAKTQLLSAADAAARAGATGLITSNSQACTDAIAAAGTNQVDGSAAVLTNSDISVGNWDDTTTPKFSTSRTPINAVQVRAQRTAVNNNAIPLSFAAVLGIRSCDVHATVVATSDFLTSGFIGLNGVDVKNNLFSASYNSSVNLNADSSHFFNHGGLGSNAAITAKNNEVVGQVILGPSGTSNLSVQSGPLVLPSDIPTPALDFSAAPATNPGGTPQALSVSGNTALAGGTYHFTSITIANNGKLSFLAPATVYIDGDVIFANNGEIEASGQIPANLTILQRGAGSVFGSSTANSLIITADVTAPQSDFAVKNSATFKGRGVFKTITSKNNLDLYYDQSLQSVLGGVVQRWPVVSVQ